MGLDLADIGCEDGREAVKSYLGAAKRFKRSKKNSDQNGADPKTCGSDAEEAALLFTDEDLALRFAELYKDHLRYVDGWKKWLLYDGKCWRMDEKKVHFNLARRLCRQVSKECKRSPKKADALASAKTVAAVISLARADPRLAATVSQWDTNPWELNTPAGVIDLHTGTVRPHRPSDHMMKITAVAPDPTCSIGTWLQFLKDITKGDKALIAYLQRVFGYCLTGSTQEQALFFGYGTGANGKTTCLTAIGRCLGAYHQVASIEMFTNSKNERHPTEIARLHGARLVTATETEEGRRWAESKIKALTGGEKIAAQFMRQDFFEFEPAFKLIITGNHKPGLRSVDEAMRRRFHLIPFAAKIPAEKRDPKLIEKLNAELPGILTWMN